MNFARIKLYSRLCVSGLAKTQEEALKFIEEMKTEIQPTPPQQFKSEIIQNKRRKTYVWKWEISYYDLKTLQEMEDDKKVKND